jgi:hypothetical protein
MNSALFPMRKNTISRLLICITLFAASTAFAQTRSGLIRLTRINTQVFVENNESGERIEKLVEEKITEQNTVVTTGPVSRVILVFSNGATINLAANSVLNIETFQQDPFGGEYSIEDATSEPEAKSVTKLHLTRGELVGNVKTLRGDLGSEFTVSTPAGAAGIRGTTFRIIYRPDGNGQAFFSVMTLEGDVAVTTTSGTTAAPISVTDEQSIEITVEVNDTTGEVTLVTPIADIVPNTATTEEVAQATASFQESAEAVVAVVLTAAADQVPVGQAAGGTSTGGSTGNGTDEGDEETKTETTGNTENTETTENSETGNSNTTGATNNQNDPTPGAGGG